LACLVLRFGDVNFVDWRNQPTAAYGQAEQTCKRGELQLLLKEDARRDFSVL
jgi:hypothetical protein